MLGREFHFFFVSAFEREQSDAAGGWILQLLAKLQFLVVKADEVVTAGALNGGMKGGKGLDEHLAFDITPARAAGYLREQLKRAFAGAEIGLMQCQIGIN